MVRTDEGPIVVVGAGMAGLAAAVELQARGYPVVVIEAGDAVGGRVRTDEVDGFLLDRGFQVLLTTYPEYQRLFPDDELELRRFDPGAMVMVGDRRHRVGDPFRRPGDVVATARAPIGSLVDKARILGFRRRVRRGSVGDLYERSETTARRRLEEQGFSNSMIRRFFEPLFSGITLEPRLEGSSRQMEFVFRMLSEGHAAVPAAGMGRLAECLAGRLPNGGVRLRERVAAIEPSGVTLDDGRHIEASGVIVATDATEAAALVETPDPGWRGVTTWWFAASESPPIGRTILLDGSKDGPATNLAVLSEVSERYAPPGRALIAVSGATVDPAADEALPGQLRRLVGPASDDWELLRTDRVPRAQPRFRPGGRRRDPRRGPRLFVAGDHLTDPSINGALRSGRRAAELVAESLS